MTDLRVADCRHASSAACAGLIGSGVVWRQGFLEHAHGLRQRPIFRAEWDAWGHCLTAAMTASRGTSAEAWALGEGREAVQDIFGQDSHEDDSHNQGVGRAIGSRARLGLLRGADPREPAAPTTRAGSGSGPTARPRGCRGAATSSAARCGTRAGAGSRPTGRTRAATSPATSATGSRRSTAARGAGRSAATSTTRATPIPAGSDVLTPSRSGPEGAARRHRAHEPASAPPEARAGSLVGRAARRRRRPLPRRVLPPLGDGADRGRLRRLGDRRALLRLRRRLLRRLARR